jgi:hypothetical protein
MGNAYVIAVSDAWDKAVCSAEGTSENGRMAKLVLLSRIGAWRLSKLRLSVPPLNGIVFAGPCSCCKLLSLFDISKAILWV